MASLKKLTGLSLESYLHELASENPVPGGGSVSAYVASLGMALTQMVGRVSLKRKKKQGLFPEDEKKEDARREKIAGIVESAEKGKRDAFNIVNTDPEAYQAVMDASGDDKKMEHALLNSFQVQADLGFLIVLARGWNNAMMELVSGSIKNDLLVADSLLSGAFDGAYYTAKINTVYMKDAAAKSKCEKNLIELMERFEKENK